MTSYEDDDYSPEDAYNRFTPIYRPDAARPPPISDEDAEDIGLDFTLDTDLLFGVTLAGPGDAEGGGPPPDLLRRAGVEVSGIDPAGWIFDETTDTVVVPLVLSVIGLFAVASNLVVLLALVGVRRMRSGPNLMLANLASADLAVVAAAVPTAVVSRVVGTLAVSALACRFVHYAIFVGVYVSMYTLVVVSVFGFFTELMRGAGNRKKYSDSGGVDDRALPVPVPLSVCSAVISSVVIWTAFGASHLTFVVQADVAGLAAFEEPLICVYGASDDSENGGTARTRTLWVTFLACAFLLPLTIVCGLSSAVLRCQRRRSQYVESSGARLPEGITSAGCGRAVETTQNLDNDGRGPRELTVLVMASTVVRTVCWLPLQIFVLADVFGPERAPWTQTAGGPEVAETAYRRKWELFCVCAALTGSCLTLPVLRVASSECRDALRLVLGRRCREADSFENHRHLADARRLQTETDSPTLTATMLHRQRNYQRDEEIVVGHSHHLSLPQIGRQSVPDVNETILSIISDSSNHINYA